MDNKLYRVECEIAGPMALFRQPANGEIHQSYPVPTPSAAKGILESVAYLARGVQFIPYEIVICNPIQFSPAPFVTNSYEPFRKSDNAAAGNAQQIFSAPLVNVRYVIRAYCRNTEVPAFGINPAHHLQDLFNRRLKKGQCFRTPCLGWAEFTPSYFGVVRNDAKPCESINMVIPALLANPHVDDEEKKYLRNVKVEKGVVTFNLAATLSTEKVAV